MFEVTDKVALVTGASSGIGLHLCGTFASRGATVFACSRSADTSPELAELARREGFDVRPLRLDVTSPDSAAAAAQAVGEAAGRLDVLINNAGNARPKRLADMSTEDWDDVLETNLRGPFLLSRAMLPLMAEGGSIINVASIGAFRAVVGLTAYNASKSGLVQFSKTLALELAAQGIRVNVVAPGYIVTPMNEGFLASSHGDSIRNKIAMKRFGTPADLDGAMIFLASDASRYMTGSCLLVDGGFLV